MLTNGTTNGQRLVKDGENELIFNFTNATNEWIDVSITIGGFLEKYEAERVLTAVGENYYSYFDDGTFYLCRAPSQTPVVTLYEVKHASANYTSSSGIFVSYIDKNGVLKIQRYYSNGNLYVETTANGNYSRCLVRVKNGYVILYVIAGNYVKTGFVGFSGTTSLTRTNIRAKEITFRTIGAKDYMLVTDIDGNVYLCTISQTDYVSVLTKRSVGKLLNAKLSVAGGDLGICHYKGGAVVERVMNGNGFFPDGKITEGDEAIITDNGYKVIRTGYNLSIH